MYYYWMKKGDRSSTVQDVQDEKGKLDTAEKKFVCWSAMAEFDQKSGGVLARIEIFS